MTHKYSQRFWLAIIALMASFSVQAQSWDFVQPHFNKLIYDIEFPNNQTRVGFIAGQGGLISRTDDGGVTFKQQESGTTTDIFDTYFADTSNGWAVGGGGTVIRTSNGGRNWRVLFSGTNGLSINAVQFTAAGANLDTGYIAGTAAFSAGVFGVVFKSVNGGSTYQAVLSPNTKVVLASIQDIGFVTPRLGYAVGFTRNFGQGVIASNAWRTSNGGTSWDSLPLPAVPIGPNVTGPVNYLCVFPVNAQTTYIGAVNGRIFKSVNAGTSWSVQTLPSTDNVLDIYFRDANNGFAVGTNGAFFKTTNGGANWLNAKQNASGTQILTPFSIQGIRAPTPTHIFIAGADGFIGRSTNAGLGFRVMNLGTSVDVAGLSCLNTNSCLIVGQGSTFIRTTNAGVNFALDSNQATNLDIKDVVWAQTNRAFVVGTAGAALEYIASTRTYRGVATTGFNSTLNSVAWGGGRVFAAVGNNGTIVTTPDNFFSFNIAQTSNKPNQSPAPQLNGVAFASGSVAVAVGQNGTVWRTSNANALSPTIPTWTRITVPASVQLNAVHFADANNGYIAGNGGNVLKTTDAGLTWSLINIAAANGALNGVYAVSPTEVYVCGAQSAVFRSTDGGANWAAESLPVDLPLTNFKKVVLVPGQGGSDGWLAGVTGILLKNWTTPRAPLSVDRNLIVSNTPVVAYPNPASTEVTFRFPQGFDQVVQAKIVNHLGMQVSGNLTWNDWATGAQTVNIAGLTPGLYQVQFMTATGRQVISFVKE